MTLNEFTIYVPHPPEVVQESLQTFADAMRNGANVPQLQSGLHGLDFILRASEMTEFQQDRYDALRFEAEWRIDLMEAQRIAEQTLEERRTEVIDRLKVLHRQIQICSKYALRDAPSAEQVYYHFYGRCLFSDKMEALMSEVTAFDDLEVSNEEN